MILPVLIVTGCGGAAEEIGEQIMDNLSAVTTNDDGTVTSLSDVGDDAIVTTSGGSDQEDTLPENANTEETSGSRTASNEENSSGDESLNEELTSEEQSDETFNEEIADNGGDTVSTNDREASGSGGETNETEAPQFSRLTVSWNIPDLRENGNVLELSEIDGYQLRFRHLDTGDEYTYRVNDPTVDNVTFQLSASYLNAAGTWEYQILAFDSDGVYGSYSDAETVQMN